MTADFSGHPDSIDDVLGHDHQTLDEALRTFSEALQTRPEAARELLERLDGRLRVHMQWEEERLFPAVRARATAAQRRSLESLEIDHERLRETLEDMKAALNRGEIPAARRRLEDLLIFLQGHNYDEEHGVYVDADRLLSPRERRELLAAFRRERAESDSSP